MKLPPFVPLDGVALTVSAVLAGLWRMGQQIQPNRPGVLPPLDELLVSLGITLALLTGAFRIGVAAWKALRELRGDGGGHKWDGAERRDLRDVRAETKDLVTILERVTSMSRDIQEGLTASIHEREDVRATLRQIEASNQRKMDLMDEMDAARLKRDEKLLGELAQLRTICGAVSLNMESTAQGVDLLLARKSDGPEPGMPRRGKGGRR